MNFLVSTKPNDGSNLFIGIKGAQQPNDGIEERINAIGELNLTRAELDLFREKIVDMRDRRICLAKSILKEFKQYEAAKFLKTLMLAGLIIGISLLALTVLAVFGGVIFATVSLANFYSSSFAVPAIIWVVMGVVIAGEIPLLSLAGYHIGKLLMNLLENGIHAIGLSRDGSLKEDPMLKVREWNNWEDHFTFYLEEGLYQAAEDAQKCLLLLERLNDPSLLDFVISGYVQNEIDQSDDLTARVRSGNKQEVLEQLSDQFEDILLSDDGIRGLPGVNELVKKVIPILPKLIKQFTL